MAINNTKGSADVNIPLPTAVLRALILLNDAGYEAYIVGGCVRDRLMGKEPSDWDITTSALPEQTLDVFSRYRTIHTGVQHGTVTVVIDEMPLEITTYRVDGAYSDGRHPDAVSFTSLLREDLRRRDFTVNAMAYHPDGGLVDYFGGRSDIQQAIIRCVGSPYERFSEDALRIIRALRFSAVLGFSIEKATADAVHRLSSTLSRVSIERITAEFKRLICGENAADIMENYTDVVSVFLPEAKGCTEYARLPQVSPQPHVRLATLFYDAKIPAETAEKALRRLRLNTQTIRDIKLLVSSCNGSTGLEDSNLLRLLNRMGPELIFDYLAIIAADAATVSRVRHLLEKGACYRLSMLSVQGDDLLSIGIPPGPLLGKWLQTLLYAVMDDVCPNDKKALLDYVRTTKKPVL